MDITQKMTSAQTRGNSRNGPEAIPAWHFAPTYPQRASVPFRQLMTAVRTSLDDGLGDRQMAQAIQGVIRGDERLAELIDADAPRSGGPLARPGLMFEQASHWRLYATGPGLPEPGATWKIPTDRVPTGSWRSPLRALAPAGQLPAAGHSRDPAVAGGALMRREHASVEFQSPGGTRIIFDPIFRSTLLGRALMMPAPEPGVAAAFVTHSHDDHFDLATLDYLAAGGTTAYVPPIPRHSFLSEDMDGLLRLCGLPRKICEPGSVTEIGDAAVEALPFFGEQPSALVSPAEAGIRNWGNCYRIDTVGFSALVLADSGTDPAGNMLAAIQDSVRRRGRIDVVLGCLRSIYLPFEIAGLPCYYTALPVSGLRSDHERLRRGTLPSATLGVAGIAAACAEAGAKTFLPYAHGLTGYGRPIEDNPFGPGPGLDEQSACRALSEELRRIGSDTVVGRWNPGDSWTPRGVRPAPGPMPEEGEWE
jgi:hypothetical protein